MKKQEAHLDLRTREGQRLEIIREVRNYGGFSIFWITAHRLRAIVGTEMVADGTIISAGGQFPFIKFSLPNVEARQEGLAENSNKENQ